jgi:hypothetical protein
LIVGSKTCPDNFVRCKIEEIVSTETAALAVSDLSRVPGIILHDREIS